MESENLINFFEIFKIPWPECGRSLERQMAAKSQRDAGDLSLTKNRNVFRDIESTRVSFIGFSVFLTRTFRRVRGNSNGEDFLRNQDSIYRWRQIAKWTPSCCLAFICINAFGNFLFFMILPTNE